MFIEQQNFFSVFRIDINSLRTLTDQQQNAIVFMIMLFFDKFLVMGLK